MTTFAQSTTLIFSLFAFICLHTKYGCRRTFRCLVSLDSCWKKVVGTWHTLHGMYYNCMPKLTYWHRIITWPTSCMCCSRDQMIFFFNLLHLFPRFWINEEVPDTNFSFFLWNRSSFCITVPGQSSTQPNPLMHMPNVGLSDFNYLTLTGVVKQNLVSRICLKSNWWPHIKVCYTINSKANTWQKFLIIGHSYFRPFRSSFGTLNYICVCIKTFVGLFSHYFKLFFLVWVDSSHPLTGTHISKTT